MGSFFQIGYGIFYDLPKVNIILAVQSDWQLYAYLDHQTFLDPISPPDNNEKNRN